MKKFKVEDIRAYFHLFLDEEVEAEDKTQAKEEILYEIMDNFGNYIDIDVIEVDDESEVVEDE